MKEGVRGKRRGEVRGEDCVARTERKIELDSCLNVQVILLYLGGAWGLIKKAIYLITPANS